MLEGFLEAAIANLVGQPAWIFAVLALPAGILASLVCPCTLAVAAGMVAVAGNAESHSSDRGTKIAMAVVGGMLLNVVSLAALVGQLGTLMSDAFTQSWAIVIAFMATLAAVAALVGPKIKLERFQNLEKAGIGGAFAFGFVFSVGTSVAPLLVVLTYGAVLANPLQAMLAGLAFGVGRVLPVILMGLLAVTAVRKTAVKNWRRGLRAASVAALSLIALFHFSIFLAPR